MLFLGHRIEGNKRAFFQGPIYFLVGPLWVAREVGDRLLGRSSRPEVSGPRYAAQTTLTVSHGRAEALDAYQPG